MSESSFSTDNHHDGSRNLSNESPVQLRQEEQPQQHRVMSVNDVLLSSSSSYNLQFDNDNNSNSDARSSMRLVRLGDPVEREALLWTLLVLLVHENGLLRSQLSIANNSQQQQQPQPLQQQENAEAPAVVPQLPGVLNSRTEHEELLMQLILAREEQLRSQIDSVPSGAVGGESNDNNHETEAAGEAPRANSSNATMFAAGAMFERLLLELRGQQQEMAALQGHAAVGVPDGQRSGVEAGAGLLNNAVVPQQQHPNEMNAVMDSTKAISAESAVNGAGESAAAALPQQRQPQHPWWDQRSLDCSSVESKGSGSNKRTKMMKSYYDSHFHRNQPYFAHDDDEIRDPSKPNANARVEKVIKCKNSQPSRKGAKEKSRKKRHHPLALGLSRSLTHDKAGLDETTTANRGGAGDHHHQLPDDMWHESFPRKLFRLLTDAEEEGNADIISFTQQGKAFNIHKPQAFLEKVAPRYFHNPRLKSIKRRLSLYGFRYSSLPTDGPFSFCHVHFQKGHPELLSRIQREYTPVSTQQQQLNVTSYATEKLPPPPQQQQDDSTT